MDFVLWKPSKPGEPRGRRPLALTPGARLAHRVLAMSWKHSAKPSTSTAVASTSCFPPRERDRAIALLVPYAGDGELWMHNGFLQVEGEKMSKSSATL
jgi:cysteinyl-tRNA synthetase